MDWKTMLAYVTGSVDENLLLRIEYLVAENRILRDQIKGRLQLSDASSGCPWQDRGRSTAISGSLAYVQTSLQS